MSLSGVDILSSSILSVCADKRESLDVHFRWDSIKKFIYLAYTYSTTQISFDMFSSAWFAKKNLYHIILLQVIVGMPYMFMDFFIKQYTRKMDTMQLLNPMLRGITYGLFVLSGLWMLKISSEESDAFRFFLSSFSEYPPWVTCSKTGIALMATLNITHCEDKANTISGCHRNESYVRVFYNTTSAYANFMVYFQHNNRTVMTTKFFVAAIVWLITFFLVTMNEENLLKYFKVTFITTTFGSFVILISLILATPFEMVMTAFVGLFEVNKEDNYDNAMDSVGPIYGIGFLGIYDFGTMSTYTMVDNCTVIYTMCILGLALVRSLILGIMNEWLKVCVNLDEEMFSLKALIFGVIPLSSEFYHANRIYIMYIYFSIFISASVSIAMFTISMSRLLSNEFRSLKYIYIVGVICCTEFFLETLVFVWVQDSETIAESISTSLNIGMVFLSGCKAAIIMWIYGVDRFSVDVQFWLGFHPTLFWKATWLLLPIILWNIAGVFSASSRYGPPELEDRKRRRKFTVNAQQRMSHHNIYDDIIECCHEAPLERGASLILLSRAPSETSVTTVFDNYYG